MHLRNFGNHVTVRAPSAPQGNQCEMTFFTLCRGYNLLFYQMMGVHVIQHFIHISITGFVKLIE